MPFFRPLPVPDFGDLEEKGEGTQVYVKLNPAKTETALACSVEDDTDLAGHGVDDQDLPAGHPDACAWLCKREAACNFWVFREQDKLCWLKTSDSGRKAAQGYIAGTKACGLSGDINRWMMDDG